MKPSDAYDSIIAALRHAGFNPTLGQEGPQIVSVIPSVAAGLGVSIMRGPPLEFCPMGSAICRSKEIRHVQKSAGHIGAMTAPQPYKILQP